MTRRRECVSVAVRVIILEAVTLAPSRKARLCNRDRSQVGSATPVSELGDNDRSCNQLGDGLQAIPATARNCDGGLRIAVGVGCKNQGVPWQPIGLRMICRTNAQASSINNEMSKVRYTAARIEPIASRCRKHAARHRLGISVPDLSCAADIRAAATTACHSGSALSAVCRVDSDV